MNSLPSVAEKIGKSAHSYLDDLLIMYNSGLSRETFEALKFFAVLMAQSKCFDEDIVTMQNFKLDKISEGTH